MKDVRDDEDFCMIVAKFAALNHVAENRLWPLLECAYGFGAVAAFGESVAVIRDSSAVAAELVRTIKAVAP